MYACTYVPGMYGSIPLVNANNMVKPKGNDQRNTLCTEQMILAAVLTGEGMHTATLKMRGKRTYSAE